MTFAHGGGEATHPTEQGGGSETNYSTISHSLSNMVSVGMANKAI